MINSLKLSGLVVTVVVSLMLHASAQAGNVLIVAGTDGLAQTAANIISADIGGANTVTIVTTGVPASLSGFTQIYDVRYANNPAFTSGEMAQYVSFLNAAPNNSIFLAGENAGFPSRNNSIRQFVTSAGGGIIGSVTTSTASEIVAPAFRSPNAISNVNFAACGLVSSAGRGQFVSSESGGGCSLYFGLGALSNAQQGALIVVNDINFIATAPTGGQASNEASFRENMEALMAAPFVAIVPTPISNTALLSLAGLLAVGGMWAMRKNKQFA